MSIRRVLLFARAVPLAAAILTLPAAASAQQSIFDGVFVSANVGLQSPATGSFTQSASTPFRDETSSQTSSYHVPTGLRLGADAGYMIRPWLGAAVGLSRFGSRDTANYALELPHPLVFNASVTKNGTTGQRLEQTQRALHLSAVFSPDLRTPMDLKIFVGPSRIYVNQQLVDDLDITETLAGSGGYDFTIDQAAIGSNSPCGCAWGFHAGADISRFLRPSVGVGASLRYSRATVQLQDAARGLIDGTMATRDYVAGGFMIAGGLRYRFPSRRFNDDN